MKAIGIQLPEEALAAAGLTDCKEGDEISISINGTVGAMGDDGYTIAATSITNGDADADEDEEGEEPKEGEGDEGEEQAASDEPSGVGYVLAQRAKKAA